MKNVLGGGNGMVPHYSGTTLDAQLRYAQGAKSILENYLENKPQDPGNLIVENGQYATRNCESIGRSGTSVSLGKCQCWRGKRLYAYWVLTRWLTNWLPNWHLYFLPTSVFSIASPTSMFQNKSNLLGLNVLCIAPMLKMRELELNCEPLIPADHFDYIAGSGAGGISAYMLGRLRMPINKAIEEYVKLMKSIFLEKKLSVSRAVYKAKNLQEALGAMIREATVKLYPDRHVACILSIGAGHAQKIQVSNPGLLRKVFHTQDVVAMRQMATDSERVAE
ncbi:Patatin domain-containing protein [Rhizoctonia solani AG-1 IA]|uniref:Patatin domain-containing protein n=1 Tax=Thanatephorus cucumeris (strain AG1-IA) TaxID=983506 RepID=L8WNV1_THACA|nr:Patatin domain-containing protein [Rhizoctonia solani AG-1 IA]